MKVCDLEGCGGGCAICQDAAHRRRHPEFTEGCMACKLDRVQFGAGTGVTVGNAPPRRAADPAWERGIAGSHRPDGSFMPLIHETDLSPIHVKEAGERRSEISAAKRRLAQPAA